MPHHSMHLTKIHTETFVGTFYQMDLAGKPIRVLISHESMEDYIKGDLSPEWDQKIYTLAARCVAAGDLEPLYDDPKIPLGVIIRTHQLG